MKLFLKSGVAVIALAVSSVASSAVINPDDIIVNIVRDGVTGDAMLINTGQSSSDVSSGTVTEYTSDSALTAAIAAFISGASDVSFWVAGGIPGSFEDFALSTAQLLNDTAVNSYVDTNLPNYQTLANNDTAFSGSANPWLAGIDSTNPLHYTNTDLYGNGLVEGVALGADGIFHKTGNSFFSTDLIREELNSWNLAADGTLSYGVSAVPVPAAVWLFGSGLVGLIGVARRRSA